LEIWETGLNRFAVFMETAPILRKLKPVFMETDPNFEKTVTLPATSYPYSVGYTLPTAIRMRGLHPQ
jgi:hypothetical protein